MAQEERKPYIGEIAPGVITTGKIDIRYAHPETAFVLRDQKDKHSWSVGSSLAVFSSEEAAKKYMDKVGLAGAVLKPFEWDKLVEKFGQGFGNCILDHSGEDGFQSVVPLRKGM